MLTSSSTRLLLFWLIVSVLAQVAQTQLFFAPFTFLLGPQITIELIVKKLIWEWLVVCRRLQLCLTIQAKGWPAGAVPVPVKRTKPRACWLVEVRIVFYRRYIDLLIDWPIVVSPSRAVVKRLVYLPFLVSQVCNLVLWCLSLPAKWYWLKQYLVLSPLALPLEFVPCSLRFAWLLLWLVDLILDLCFLESSCLCFGLEKLELCIFWVALIEVLGGRVVLGLCQE